MWIPLFVSCAPDDPTVRASAGLTLADVPLPAPLAGLTDDGTVFLTDGTVWRAQLRGGANGVSLTPVEPPSPPSPELWPDLLPDSVPLAPLHPNLSRAWLAGPTDRYAHGVLGDGLEASSVQVVTAEGAALAFEATGDSVFEDLRVREIHEHAWLWVVRSNPRLGAEPVLLAHDGDALTVMAEGPGVGTGYRWLAPVGAGDLLGDGGLASPGSSAPILTAR